MGDPTSPFVDSWEKGNGNGLRGTSFVTEVIPSFNARCTWQGFVGTYGPARVGFQSRWVYFENGVPSAIQVNQMVRGPGLGIRNYVNSIDISNKRISMQAPSVNASGSGQYFMFNSETASKIWLICPQQQFKNIGNGRTPIGQFLFGPYFAPGTWIIDNSCDGTNCNIALSTPPIANIPNTTITFVGYVFLDRETWDGGGMWPGRANFEMTTLTFSKQTFNPGYNYTRQYVACNPWTPSQVRAASGIPTVNPFRIFENGFENFYPDV
jgi:hypothetical protein